MLLKTKATVKLVYTKWRILGICCIFLYFQLQIRALFIDFETHVFIRFLISIKFSIIISHKKRGGGRKSSSAQIIYMAKTTIRHLLPHTHTYQKSIYANNKRVNKNFKNEARKFQKIQNLYLQTILFTFFFFFIRTVVLITKFNLYIK